MAERDPSLLELRVLSGWHAGASALLPASGALAVGAAGAGADVVLRDLPGDAGGTVEPAAEGWRWNPAGGALLEVAFGQVIQCGDILLAIQPVDSPWPSDGEIETLRTGALSADAAPRADGVAAGEQSREEDGEEAQPPPDDTPSPTTAVEPNLARRRTSPWVTGLCAVSLGLACFALLTVLLIQWAIPAEPLPVEEPAGFDAGALHDLIGELSLDARLVIVTTAGGRVSVRGVVAGEEQLERLMNALARLPRSPGTWVMTSADLVVQASEIAHTLEPGVSVLAGQTGVLELAGVVRDDDSARSLIARLTESLPDGIEVRDETQRGQLVVAAFGEALAERNLPALALAWEDGILRVTGRLGEEHLLAWEDLLLEFDRRFDHRARFSASVQLPSPGEFLRRHVNAIIGGAAPYVVLTNGRKVLAGGQVGNYRLVEIRDTLSVWEWSGGRHPFAIER